MSAQKLILDDAAALAAAGAEAFCRAAEGSAGPFRVALSGGSTPRALYALLAYEKAPYRARLPWDRMHFFWGDERCVPPDDDESNYRMAREALLSKAPIPEANVHRIEGELPADQAAARYEELLMREFDGLPRFDWIFLGLGADGHTGSLFPGTPALTEINKLVTSVWVPEKKLLRVTMTFPVMCAAKKAAFLILGPDKAESARRLIEGGPQMDVPASLVRPLRGDLLYFLDRAAAGRLAP